LAEVKIEVSRTVSGVTIRTVPPLERTGNTGARYQVRLPRQAFLELVKSTNGSVRVSSIDRPVNIRTTNGAVRVAEVKGDVSAVSTNGALECVAIEGRLFVRTTNGRVKVEEVRGALEASTTNGTILASVAEIRDARSLRLSTTNGSINLKLPQALRADVRASTSNGSIDVKIPAGANFNVSARTSSSSVRSDFSIEGEVTKNRAEGKVGSGGPLLDLSTSNGGINLERLM
jgi:DUF4097 and DUF4098 domain-containing protein YvlB